MDSETDMPLLARHVPSGTQLPECWNQGMDLLICWHEAADLATIPQIIDELKSQYRYLNKYIVTEDAIERRIKCLEISNNNYFKGGMKAACDRAEESGFVIKPYDGDNYPYLDEETRAAITRLADAQPKARNMEQDENLPTGIRRVSDDVGCGQYSPRSKNETADNIMSDSLQSIAGSTPSRQRVMNNERIGYTIARNNSAERNSMKDLSNTRTPPTASTDVFGTVSRSSTAVSTPSNPNFSMPMSGSPSKAKHRPAPLDLSGSTSFNSRKGGNTAVGRADGLAWKDRIKGKV